MSFDRNRLSRVAEQPFIPRERGSGPRMATQNYFDRHGLSLSLRMELGSNEAIKQAILGGLGIAVLSKHALGMGSDQSGLTILNVEGFPIPW
jgi:DNA-binding transcriptional LysR family regulator